MDFFGCDGVKNNFLVLGSYFFGPFSLVIFVTDWGLEPDLGAADYSLVALITALTDIILSESELPSPLSGLVLLESLFLANYTILVCEALFSITFIFS